MKFEKITRRAGLFALVAVALVGAPALAQERMRITLDTNPSHIRNKGVAIFAEELKKRVGDKIAVEIYPSAQLFRDRDVPKALRQGAVEMAVPGTWQLDGIEPSAALQTLPMFYGLEPSVVKQVMDGKLGDFLDKRFGERLRVKIPGKWLDLGSSNFFGIDKPMSSYDDLKEQKIRYPGGTANAARINALGANAVLVPFPDVPMAMSQGVIDGVATTYESVASSKLQESGLKRAFEDDHFFGQYVPMISLSFWQKLPKDQQEAILAAWDVAAKAQREMALTAQDEARELLIKGGMKVIKPTPAEVLAKRKMLMGIQPDLVKQMKIDDDAVDAARSELIAAGVQL